MHNPKVSKAENQVKVSKSLFIVCWWNGGGALKRRLKANPGLKTLLEKNPEIFVYAESEMSNSSGLFLKGYKFIFHRSFIKIPDNYRRGLVIFYDEKYEHKISKSFASKIFDIVWLRIKTSTTALFVCFFYAPGAHLPEEIRVKFYNIFTTKYDKFATKGEVILIGDSNARL